VNSPEIPPADTADEGLLSDPEFRQLLARRSRLRWSLSGVLIAAYVIWALAGLYAQDALGATFMESSLTWGMVFGYLIIAVSIVCSIVYIQMINRIYLSLDLGKQDRN
jgi:uncharacterized membrane protein (DUF485 family)